MIINFTSYSYTYTSFGILRKGRKMKILLISIPVGYNNICFYLIMHFQNFGAADSQDPTVHTANQSQIRLTKKSPFVSQVKYMLGKKRKVYNLSHKARQLYAIHKR